MNRTQIKYFEHRMEEIKQLKRCEIYNASSSKADKVVRIKSRVLAYMQKHKRAVMQQLYDKALEILNSDMWNSGVDLTSDGSRGVAYKPEFVLDAIKAYDNDMDVLAKEREVKCEELNKKFTELMDKFYLSDCPDCTALMEELRSF